MPTTTYRTFTIQVFDVDMKQLLSTTALTYKACAEVPSWTPLRIELAADARR